MSDDEAAGLPSLGHEAAAALRIAVPVAVANLAERFAFWVAWAVVGQLGPEFLGPVSFASSVVNVFGTSITIGLSIAVSTLASQAAGAKSDRALGLVLQRSLPICLVFSLPVIVLLLLLEPVLLASGLDAAFAQRAGRYGLTLLPTALLSGQLRAMQTWLSAQSITRPQLVLSIAVLPCHAALCVGLVNYSPLGYLGAGIAMSATMALRAAVLYSYIRCSPHCRRTYPGWRPSDALTGWCAQLVLAVAAIAYWRGGSVSGGRPGVHQVVCSA